jgi:hypothetical protein
MVIPPYPWTSPRHGYERSFHGGAPKLVLDTQKAHLEETRLGSFAIVAVPVMPGETGNRGFCGDSTGRLCVSDDGSAPSVKDGRCSVPCAELR